jgi:hypothetical protein
VTLLDALHDTFLDEVSRSLVLLARKLLRSSD